MHASAWLVCGLVLTQSSATAPPAKPPASIPTQWSAPVTVKSKATSGPASELDSTARDPQSPSRSPRTLPPLRPTQSPVVVTGETSVEDGEPLEEERAAPPPRPFSPSDSQPLVQPQTQRPPATFAPPADTARPLRYEDQGTKPVNFEAPAPTSAASLLIRHAMTSPDDESWRLPGAPFALYSALDRSSDRTSRLSLVRAYWRMTTEVASYNWAVEEGAFIAGLQAAGRGPEEFLLNAARLDAQAHLQSAKVAAAGAQQDLAEYARMPLQSPPPLPLDQPLATAYQTKFDRIFANRTPPAGLRRIAQTIPLQLELVDTRASAVAADTDAIKELAAAHRQGQATLDSVIAAHERLYRHRREFLQSLRVYNELIAEYALAVGGSSPNETLVSMLIRNPHTPRDVEVARARAGGYEEAQAVNTVRNSPAYVPPTQNEMLGGPSTDASPRTSSRSSGNGSWMSPRTTVRDNSIRGTAAVEEPTTRFAPRPNAGDMQESPANVPPPRGFQGDASPVEEAEGAGEPAMENSQFGDPSAAAESPEGADARPSLGSPFPGR
ncbi:MAG: hypothetical protein U0939_15870 [Pirellulales bacterium]